MTEQNQPDVTVGRVASIDALRGFSMFWIVGGVGVFHGLHTVSDHSATAWLTTQFSHVKWEGFHFLDLIWPLFLFLTGAVLPFSIPRRLAHGHNRVVVPRHIVTRAVVLILLGLIYGGLLDLRFAEMRWSAVLTMIGLSYFVAATIVLTTCDA